MYELTVQTHFDAAHFLIDYPGECARLHGHTYVVEVTVAGDKLNEIGLLYDFKDLKDKTREIIDRFDHHYLNEIAPFDKTSPTAENLAKYIYDHLKKRLVAKGIKIAEVSVWESPTARLTYRES